MRDYYSGKASATAAYVLINLGFNARHVIINNSGNSSVDLMYSFNGTDAKGHIEPDETLILKGSKFTMKRFWIKGNGGTPTYRIWAWD